ncbi:uncharacterized protein A4U43_C08F26360 [Asparagus officinalis]|uniref:uncharacterized protein LOC109822580 n=1 Tax=Asparagus officinalis TaxID=4686 RepID=UPI00098DE85C|nr:uncharacterized protein LOC109822580 [Asparagus officinalis]ONK61111.1 uncharacterized protein A4U43_C08F26360 [Asparagus officinalis]
MAKTSIVSLVILFLSLASSDDSVHSLLRDHGLPAGLLPKTVHSFSLEPSTGLLAVQLHGPCIAQYERSPVRFDQEINANLTFGSLKGVKGLTQEELFLWLPIKEILVTDPKSGVILFDIGMAHKQLSVSIFENPPDCKEDGGPELRTAAGFQEQR